MGQLHLPPPTTEHTLMVAQGSGSLPHLFIVGLKQDGVEDRPTIGGAFSGSTQAGRWSPGMPAGLCETFDCNQPPHWWVHFEWHIAVKPLEVAGSSAFSSGSNDLCHHLPHFRWFLPTKRLDQHSEWATPRCCCLGWCCCHH